MTAVKCPVCEGTGWLVTQIMSASFPPAGQTCHGCNGKGWLLIDPTNYSHAASDPVRRSRNVGGVRCG